MSADLAVERLLGVPVRSLSGGRVGRAVLADGRTVVVKQDPSVPAEAAGLRWIAVRGGPRVPAVLGADEQWLVMDAVEETAPTRRAAEVFGARLATVHRAGAPAFGAAPPGGPVEAWIGRARMRNLQGPRWPAWYAEHRVLPYARAAFDAGALPDLAPVERVCERIAELAGPAEEPARLHGDLWSGNVLWSPEGVWLIDPAAHGGHRETDLAMLALFGCPHLTTILAAYDEAHPLAEGWQARVPLHQLFPLLVHAVLFGGSYGAQAVAAAHTALGDRARRS